MLTNFKMGEQRELKEYPLVHDVLGNTPAKVQHTFSSIPANILCFDVAKAYIVFGTSAGCAFLHNRESGHVIKVISENKGDHVTAVKLLIGLECQLALGTNDGKLVIAIFAGSTAGSKQVHKFSLGKIHKSSVCCLEWSANGMKLFSADVSGQIFCTDVNIDLRTCSSDLLLTENSEVVQMCYKHKTLLVCTLDKSFLFHDGHKRDIGSKPTRKGRYGACFNSGTVAKDELKVFATRPGLRIWVVDIDGKVLNTIKMKTLVANSNAHISMCSDTDFSIVEKEYTFGNILLFGKTCLVTYHASSLYIIDCVNNLLIGEIHNLRNLIDVNLTEDEIFVLCTGRKLHRIAYGPDENVTSMGLSFHDNADRSKFEEMKKSITEMKMNFLPIIGTLQSKMNALKVDHLTNKLQVQTEDLHHEVLSNPILNITEHFFSNLKSDVDSVEANISHKSADEEEQSYCKELSLESIDDVIKQIMYDMISQVEGSTDVIKDNQDIVKVGKLSRFDVIDIEFENGDIVFSSKRKKKNHKVLVSTTTPSCSVNSENEEIVHSISKQIKTELLSTVHLDTDVKLQPFEKDISPNASQDLPYFSVAQEHVYQHQMEEYTLPIQTENAQHKLMNNAELSVELDETKNGKTSKTFLKFKHTHSKEGIEDTENIQPILSNEKIVEQNINLKCIPMKTFSYEENSKNADVTNDGNQFSIQNVPDCSNIQSKVIFALNIENRCDNVESSLSPDVDIYGMHEGGDLGSEEESETESQQSVEPVNPYEGAIIEDEQYFKKLFHLKPELYGPSGQSLKSTDVWKLRNFPGNTVSSLSGSGELICCITSSHRVYCKREVSDELADTIWNKIAKKAVQIAIAPSGDFAWIVTYKGNVYAVSLPLNLTDDPFHSTEIHFEWVLVHTKCLFVCLGTNEAWIVSEDGQVLREIGLSRSQPSIKQEYVVDVTFVDGDMVASAKVKQVTLTSEVVWILTVCGRLLCKSLLMVDCKNNWEEVKSPWIFNNTQCEIKQITSDHGTTVWVVDDTGGLWYRSKVSFDHPCGQYWWKVYMNQYMYEDNSSSFLHSLLPAKTPPSASVTDVALSFQAIWVACEDNKLRVSKARLTGHRWSPANISGVAASTKWHHITSSSMFSPEDGTWQSYIWVTQSKGEVICFPTTPSNMHRTVALPPPGESGSSVISLSASREALWMILETGEVFVRSDISPSLISGGQWKKVNVGSQLGQAQLVSVSCGSQCVWAVDDMGDIHMRMGTVVTDNHETMTPAWLTLDPCPTRGSHFVQVVCGSSDLSVWVLDDKGNPYVRVGVTPELPVGEAWRAVPGALVQQIVISNHTVWALCTDGNILQRCGITFSDSLGDYWTKLPGAFRKLSVTPYDKLWAIDDQQRLYYHQTLFYSPPMIQAMLGDDTSSVSDNEYENTKLETSEECEDLSWEII